MEEDFGQLRSLLNGEVSAETWAQVCELLLSLSESEHGRLLEEDWRHYITTHLERFPDELRAAPETWFDPINLDLLHFARDARSKIARDLHRPRSSTPKPWPEARGVIIPKQSPEPREVRHIDLGQQSALSLHKPEGSDIFVAGCSDGFWGIWDEESLELRASGRVDKRTSGHRIRQIRLSPDGERLALSVQTSGEWIERDLLLVETRTGELLATYPYRFKQKFRWTPDGQHLISHTINHTKIIDRDGGKVWEHEWATRGASRHTIGERMIHANRDSELLQLPLCGCRETTSALPDLHRRVQSYRWDEDGFVCAPQHGMLAMSTTSLREECHLLCELEDPSKVRVSFSLDGSWEQIVGHHTAWAERAERIALALVHIYAREVTYAIYDAVEGAFICAHEANLYGYYSPDPRSIFIRDDSAIVVNDGTALAIVSW